MVAARRAGGAVASSG